MPDIEQELILTDNFTKTFDSFIEKLDKTINKLESFKSVSKSQNDNMDDMLKNLEKFNRAADRLNSGGFGKLISSITTLGGAYLGISKLGEVLKSSYLTLDDSVRLANKFGSYDQVKNNSKEYYENNNNVIESNYSQLEKSITDKMTMVRYNLGSQYGMSMNESSATLSALSKITSNSERISQLLDMSARLTAIKPGTTVAENAQSLSSMILSRDASSLTSEFGLDARGIKTSRINWELQNGRFDAALEEIDKLAQKAGATEQALNRMTDTPLYKLNILKETLNNGLILGAQSFIKALDPLLSKLTEIVRTRSFIESVSNAFFSIGKAVNLVVSNLDKITTVLMALIGAWGALTVAINLANIAQMIFALSNPIGLVIVSVVALGSAFTVILYKINEARTGMSGFGSALITAVQLGITGINYFIAVINNLLMFINNFKILFSGIGEFLANIFINPIASIISLFQTLFNVILNAALGVMKILEFVTVGYSKGLTEIVDKIGKSVNSSFEYNINAVGGLNSVGNNQANKEDYLNYLNYNPSFEIENLLKGFNFKDEDKTNDLLEGILGNVIRGSDNLESINYKWDPDAWIDGFKEFVGAEMERNSVIRLNNQISTPTINIAVNNNGNVDKDIDYSQLASVLSDILMSQIQGSSNAAYNI